MSPDAAQTRERRTVLLVDDEVLIRECVGDMLCFLGHQPVSAATGEEALSLLGGGLRPDLVILDMDMPGRGGAATLVDLHAEWTGLPVIISTGRVDGTVRELLRCHPGVGLLPKPFDLFQLRERIEATDIHLGGAQAS